MNLQKSETSRVLSSRLLEVLCAFFLTRSFLCWCSGVFVDFSKTMMCAFPRKRNVRASRSRKTPLSAREKNSRRFLTSVFAQVKRKEREIRVLVVGLDNAGKTTVVKKINGEDISKISPTLGFNISSLHLNAYRLNVWDVGGQKTLRTFWRNYFEKTDALVWVVDSTDVARLQDCKNELDAILKEEKLVDASLLVLANKQDVEGAMSGRDIAEALGLVSIGSSNSVSVSSSEVLSGMTSNSSKRRWRVQKCSATTGDGILDGFEFITEDVGSRMFTLD